MRISTTGRRMRLGCVPEYIGVIRQAIYKEEGGTGE